MSGHFPRLSLETQSFHPSNETRMGVGHARNALAKSAENGGLSKIVVSIVQGTVTTTTVN